MPFLHTAAAAALVLSLAWSTYADCESYGIDFQDQGGPYFQNSESTDPFTALQDFTGCQNDTAYNIFVDTFGDQNECSNTPLLPDNTPQVVTCPNNPKDSLVTGDYSIVIISNNGDGDPIAYERDFELTVGPQATVTVTPTVTNTVISTPQTTATTTSTSTLSITSVKSVTLKPSTTTSTTTKALFTITQYKNYWTVSSTQVTKPASCVKITSTKVKDPIATIRPTILPGKLNSLAQDIIKDVDCTLSALLGKPCKREANAADALSDDLAASAKFKRALLEGRTPDEELKAAYVRERRARLAARPQKRFIDQPTTTATASIAVTATTTSVAPVFTQTSTSVLTSTSTIVVQYTIKPPVVTVVKTVLKPLVLTTKSVTFTRKVTHTITTTSSGAASACAKSTGTLAGS